MLGYEHFYARLTESNTVIVYANIYNVYRNMNSAHLHVQWNL